MRFILWEQEHVRQPQQPPHNNKKQPAVIQNSNHRWLLFTVMLRLFNAVAYTLF